MPGTQGPNLGVTWGYSIGENGWGVGGFNPNFAQLDTIVNLAVIEVRNTPPVSPVNGDRYIVGGSPTGAFTAHTNAIAVYLTTGTPGWVFYVPKLGWRAWNADLNSYVRFNGSAWVTNIGSTLRAIAFSSNATTLLAADQIIFFHKLAFDWTIPADFGDFQSASTQFGGMAVAADGDVVFRIQQADSATPLTFSDVGTITIGNGTVTVSDLDSSATDIVFLKGDVVKILAPTVPDSGFKGPFGTLVGYEP